MISTPPVSVVPQIERSGRVIQAEKPQEPSRGDSSDEHLSVVHFIPIEKISSNPSQPRQRFMDSELRELADSIRTKGMLQPVLVRPSPNKLGGEAAYEIVAGERRWRAAKLAGLHQLPVIIRHIGDGESLELALVENVQREDLNPVEQAQAYQRLSDEFNLSQQEVADKVGKDRASIANFTRLLKLPPDVLDLLRSNELSMGHAKAILAVKEQSAQSSLARKAVKEGLSVRALEAIVARVVVLDSGRRLVSRDGRLGAGKSASKSFPEVIDRMRNSLGTKVDIRHQRSGRGKIEIEYFSEQELDRIVEHICTRQELRAY